MLVLGFDTDGSATMTVPPSHEPTVIKVMLVRAQPGHARIGFAAPKVVGILRDGAVMKTSAGQAAIGRCE